MSKFQDIAEIKRIEAEYSSSAERWELEDWMSQQLFDHYRKDAELNEEMFRFGDAVVMYLPKSLTFNITRILDRNVLEHSVSLQQYLYSHYGIQHVCEIKTDLKFSESDFELMAMQLAEDIVGWYENITLVLQAASKGIL